ncbi:MAG: polysaccharide biosynthesis/export protein [Acidobacteriota bacterium]|jgi:protein involved in polysaccharide export with SLBB domain|nr:polysaccharide biosynthesis/export protein [Acidobacteriota bacterium]
MKKVLSVLVIALALSVSSSARTQSNSLAPAGSDNGKSGKAEDDKTAKSKGSGKSADDPKDKKNKEQGNSSTPATTDAPEKTTTTVPSGTSATSNPPTTEEPAAKANATTNAPPLTSIYRVGAGDVLDIRLLNAATRDSTLFTVMASGLLEYPLAGEPLPVAGLTTDEIHERLISKIKLYDNPQVVVSVRQYASHNVIVSGLVNDPGTRALRREAMPLYVVLAEAQLKPEAGQATIVRVDRQTLTISLSDPKAMTTFVLPGDVVTVTALPPAPPQFFYIGGQINSPGQKDFHAGMTLTQAVLASGGATRFAGGKVKVSRQGADGRLVTTEYNLKQIESGKIPDPVLQPGDRVDVGRGGW